MKALQLPMEGSSISEDSPSPQMYAFCGTFKQNYWTVVRKSMRDGLKTRNRKMESTNMFQDVKLHKLGADWRIMAKPCRPLTRQHKQSSHLIAIAQHNFAKHTFQSRPSKACEAGSAAPSVTQSLFEGAWLRPSAHPSQRHQANLLVFPRISTNPWTEAVQSRGRSSGTGPLTILRSRTGAAASRIIVERSF